MMFTGNSLFTKVQCKNADVQTVHQKYTKFISHQAICRIALFNAQLSHMSLLMIIWITCKTCIWIDTKKDTNSVQIEFENIPYI